MPYEVSIVICAYTEKRWQALVAAIESVRHQTLPAREIILVIDHNSALFQRAQACFANDRLLDKVLADVQSGQALKVRATPTLFINEQFYGNPADGAEGIAAILSQVGR